MTVNEAMFGRIADQIEQHPDQYNQQDWDKSECGTVCCIGGWALMLAATPDKLAAARADTEEGTRSFLLYLSRRMGFHSIGFAAEQILGLTTHEALALFNGEWEAKGGDVPAALRAIGRGASVMDVTR